MSPVFKKFTKYMREEIQKSFDQQGPGWPEKKNKDAAGLHSKIQSRTINSMRSKLKLQIQKAKKRKSSVYLANAVGNYTYISPEKQKKLEKSIETKVEKLKAFNEIAKGQTAPKTNLTPKQMKSLQGQIQRQQDKSAKTLGRLASSISTKLTKTSLEMYSRANYSGVQNEGGAVGHNAILPARPFLFLNDERIGKFGQLVTEHVGKSLEKSTT